MMKDQIQDIVATAVGRLPARASHPEIAGITPVIERTRDAAHGDYACNVAMQLAKTLGMKPRDLAQSIVDQIPDSAEIAGIDIAGPGFINFRLSEAAFHDELRSIVSLGDAYGRSDSGTGTRIIVEYVSANPTGPLHVGHGRHAAYGASVANLLKATGHDVHQEYYVNDAGRQMNVLTLSVWLRMLGLAGIEARFPHNAYRGDYVVDIARENVSEFPAAVDPAAVPAPDAFPAVNEAELADIENADGMSDGEKDERIKNVHERHLDRLVIFAKEVLGEDQFDAIHQVTLESILGDIRDDLAEFGVVPDEWFSERSLMTDGAVTRALVRVREQGKSYEKDGAVWFRSTDYGDEKDRCIVRDNGVTTYFASDIAYHLNKRERGFDRMLDIFGADHHGYMTRVRGGVEAMGEPPDSLSFELVQFVVLWRNGKKIQMSTRSGEFDTLRKLREQVGNDATRFFFVSRSNDQHLDFDLDLAVSRSNDNPVYYIQYAHARVWSVMRELEKRGLSWAPDATGDLTLLTESHELSLMQRLMRYPEVIELASKNLAPQNVVHYLTELAQEFHTYYNAHKFIADEDALRDARLFLINAVRQVISNGLGIIGVSAPRSM